MRVLETNEGSHQGQLPGYESASIENNSGTRAVPLTRKAQPNEFANQSSDALSPCAGRGSLTQETPAFAERSCALSLQQAFRDLHCVQRRTFQQLVARDEQGHRATRRIAQILANATDENLVATRGILRHREVVVLHIVDHANARRRLQQRPHLRDIDGCSHSTVALMQ